MPWSAPGGGVTLVSPSVTISSALCSKPGMVRYCKLLLLWPQTPSSISQAIPIANSILKTRFTAHNKPWKLVSVIISFSNLQRGQWVTFILGKLCYASRKHNCFGCAGSNLPWRAHHNIAEFPWKLVHKVE